MMKYVFKNADLKPIPASCLIEDYDALRKIAMGLSEGTMDVGDAIESVHATMECIAEQIHADDAVGFEVSPSTLVAPGCANGVICHEDGTDVCCAAGFPVGTRMSGGVTQCDGACMKAHGCSPDDGVMRLEDGYVLDRSRNMNDWQEELVEHLNIDLNA